MHDAKREKLIDDLRATGHEVTITGDCLTVRPKKLERAPVLSEFAAYDIYYDKCEAANKIPLTYKAWQEAGRP